MKKSIVMARWNNEAAVWVATSDDIPGNLIDIRI